MVKLDLLKESLTFKPVGVLYKARDKPPAKLDAAMNAIDLVAGRSLMAVGVMTLLDDVLLPVVSALVRDVWVRESMRLLAVLSMQRFDAGYV